MADYSNSKYEITILDDCIFKLKPFEGVELDVDDVHEMRRIYLQFSKGKDFAILLDATQSFSPTGEARTLLASKEFTDKRIAAAFVTTTLSNRLIGNFFIKVNKPLTSTKLFNDEISAFAWLKEQMKGK